MSKNQKMNSKTSFPWDIVPIFLVLTVLTFTKFFPWLSEQYMWFFDYDDKSKAYVIVVFIALLIIAAICFTIYMIDRSKERDELYKKHLETIERDRREAAKRTYKASPDKIEKTKPPKASKPFKTTSVSDGDSEDEYTQRSKSKSDELSKAGFKVVKKSRGS